MSTGEKRVMIFSSAGPARSWDEVSALYTHRNPSDPLRSSVCQQIHDEAIEKIRPVLETLKETVCA